MSVRRSEIEDLQRRIRHGAQLQKRGLSAHERRWLSKLNLEVIALDNAADAERLKAPVPPIRKSIPPGPAYRDPKTLPASMRPGARGND